LRAPRAILDEAGFSVSDLQSGPRSPPTVETTRVSAASARRP